MAVRVMVSEKKAGADNVKTICDYPGHEEGYIRHGDGCPKSGERDFSGVHGPDCVLRGDSYGVDSSGIKRCYEEFCGAPFKPLYMETTYKGRVVATGERNMRDDSDFYCVVKEDDGSYRKITYASTRGWTYPNSASIDASPEEVSAYHAYETKVYDGLAKARCAADLKARKDRGEHINKGDHVCVVKGRKVKRGTKGLVFWAGEGRYGKYRIGFNDSDGETHWTAATNVEVVA